MGYIGGSAGGTLTFNSISSTVATTTTIRIHYTNGDSTQRYSNVVVNGQTYVVAFCPTGGDTTPGTSTLTVPLKSGSGNVIEFEAYNGGWGELTSRSREEADRRSSEYRPLDGAGVLRKNCVLI